MPDLLMKFKNASLFKDIDEGVVAELYNKAEKRFYDTGSAVIHQGDIGTAIYIIISGYLLVIFKNEDQREYAVSILGPGDYFGEISIFGDNKRSSHVKAKTKSELFIIKNCDLIEATKNDPKIWKNLFINACNIITKNNETHASAIFESAEQRIYRALKELSDKYRTKKNGKKIIIKTSVTDISTFAGIGRPTTSKILNDFERKKIISKGNKVITLCGEEFYND